MQRSSTPLVLPFLGLVLACGSAPDSSDTDWRVYLGDNGRQHYSELTQITRENVADLELAWTYDSGETRGSGSTMYTSPLVVNGVFYGLSPKLVPFALDAATGSEIWRHDLELRGTPQRGLMYWEKGSDRRLFFTHAADLYALNASDGSVVESFGDGGKVDLKPDIGRDGPMFVSVPGVVFEDLIMTGFSTSEDARSYPGTVRAFSAVDGSLVWQFDMIPKPGDRGSETWAEGSYEKAGGANVWTGMALDEERGILYAPTGSATPDFYGANRLGDNLYSDSLVALDARTGEYIWHYQVIKHDVWDRDNPSPPTLVQLERDGTLIDAVALTTKGGHLYLFDRETGESLYELIELETPIPSTLPGEETAKTQRVSSVEIARQKFAITERTPEAYEFVKEKIKDWDTRPWAPPKVGTLLIYPWYDGGAEWGGSAYDPNGHKLVLNANDAAGILELTEVPKGTSNYSVYMQHCSTCHGENLEGNDVGPELLGIRDRMEISEIAEIIREGAGRMPGFAHLDTAQFRATIAYISNPEPEPDEPTDELSYVLGGYVYLRDHENLPGNTPPWGTLNSFDLATGNLDWSIPFGNYPSHPDLGYGAVNYGGPIITATGVIFIAATPDHLFKAYDTRDGALLWQTELSASGYSTPITYSVDGKQYVAIASGGGRTGGPSAADYFAYALPD